jgi:dedicated sortase system histidine kinase
MIGFFQSLRFKLFAASLTLLVIPWVGYYYLLEMEATLRQAQSELLLSRAEIVSNLLADRLLKSNLNKNSTSKQMEQNSLYVHALKNAPTVDGYAEEWKNLLTQAHRYQASETQSDAVSFELLAGHHDEQLYLLLSVRDKTPFYPSADGPLTSGDHLILVLPGEEQNYQRFLLGTSAPGWLRVQAANTQLKERAIKGEWQEIEGGYRVELKLPLSLVKQQLSLAVIDKDSQGIQPTTVASTSGWQANLSLAKLVMATLPSDQLLQGLESRDYRYTILNKERQIIGRHGRLRVDEEEAVSLLNQYLQRLLTNRSATEDPQREHSGRMDGPEIRRAIKGEEAIHRYRSSQYGGVVLSAAYPLPAPSGQPAGAIVVEETSQAILLLQQQALKRLLFYTLLMFIVTGGSLLLLAIYLTRRITQLRGKFDRAVSQDGRVLMTPNPTDRKDELADLENNFASVLQRLQEYNHYLENMADKLAHEFRTPLTMVQSSLENLRLDDSGLTHSLYTERALEGTNRLQATLHRLREASHLEQTLQGVEMHDVNICELLNNLCEGYRSAYSEVDFECLCEAEGLQLTIAPDLIGQALDKLVSNAVDFHTASTPIRLELHQNKPPQVDIKVINLGPPLPEAGPESLFQSMTSLRTRKDGEPHLGLGLYLVKLIAEFHGGEAKAEDIDGGVCFSISLPQN